ncbi:MAG: LamG-like jellyroll fold domain-containing protein [Candidatus Competibacteraceae bacterium]
MKIRLLGLFLVVYHTLALAAGNLTETFEAPGGTDNDYEIQLAPGNMLDPNYSNSGLPSSWGTKSGFIVIGGSSSPNGGALWRKNSAPSPTGYHFTASLLIAVDGLLAGDGISLFVSKSIDERFAAWRLYMHKNSQGQLELALMLGLNTDTNNPSAAAYSIPITTNQIYDVAITYDTERRVYSWSVNGQLQAYADMPCDYPLIATKVIGSSRSSSGRDSAFIVDNVRWYELPPSSQFGPRNCGSP